MLFGMGPMELGVILLVVMVIFGPKNLPKLGSALGKTVKNVREGMGDDAPEPEASPVSAAVETAEKDDSAAR
ncbi:twin-arginine translocase TatA/TatE family subunit [Olsenella sp. An290]|uniref:Sec-independent protein translocase subunit TatA/TatB n=1 Tax=Olsenella sp. An290 TaxID=1965625 RepID=UPI000B3A2688|nr:twin-arginine translocase TatA/TatE family subunit [Olsenella sp. An290]OUO34682.1 twin-arginine translocase TatA/TatE family subunit [Olsenella sp. An290]